MIKENIMRAVTGFVLDKTLKYVDKDPKKNIVKLINKAEFISGKTFPKKVFDSFRTAVQDDDNVWADYVMRILRDIDRENLKKAFLSFVLGAGYHGTKAVRKNREKYKCNIPFLMLLDPTSACNLRCKGCWSAEYGHKFNLSFEEMDSIVSQGVALGPPKESNSEVGVMTKQEVIEKLNVSSTTLWLWEKKKYLVSVKIGRRIFYRRCDIENLMEGKRV